MPIFFNIYEPRNFLMEMGYVYTVRHQRSTGITDARHGGFMKFDSLGKVKVEEIKELHWDSLEQFLIQFIKESGFSSLSDWRFAIKKWKDPMNLYKVSFVEKSPPEGEK